MSLYEPQSVPLLSGLTFSLVNFLTKSPLFWCHAVAGLISQFSENLHDAELVSRASECQRHTSLYNEHSNQDELIKAVLLAGFYPNLIQVHGDFSGWSL